MATRRRTTMPRPFWPSAVCSGEPADRLADEIGGSTAYCGRPPGEEKLTKDVPDWKGQQVRAGYDQVWLAAPNSRWTTATPSGRNG